MAGMALARAWKQMSWFYYQYLLVTALYMLEPWERTVFSILLTGLQASWESPACISCLDGVLAVSPGDMKLELHD
uniref:Serine palmitoyltransferase, small subunit A n=1 Tax=Mus musculus TaxID=10090 RepID=A0A1W2P6D8_MOUSE